MSSIEIFVDDERFGIKENNIEVVPAVHKSPAGAIEEWEYFEKLNNVKQFLPFKKSYETIIKISNTLKNESKAKI